MDRRVIIVEVRRVRRGYGEGWTGEDGEDVAFHGLFVEAVEAETGGWWGAGGACSGEAADCGEGVHEDAVD